MDADDAIGADERSGGWGDSDGWNDGGDDGWDFPTTSSPSSPGKNSTRGAASGAGSSGLSKLEQRALMRNHKKHEAGKKD